ncbi:MAG TPA: hypothetical protein VIL69_09340 [Roseomonas sp.]
MGGFTVGAGRRCALPWWRGTTLRVALERQCLRAMTLRVPRRTMLRIA